MAKYTIEVDIIFLAYFGVFSIVVSYPNTPDFLLSDKSIVYSVINCLNLFLRISKHHDVYLY